MQTERDIKRLLTQEASSTNTAAKYRQLAAEAVKVGLPDESFPLLDTAIEYDSYADDIREQLIALGYTPE